MNEAQRSLIRLHAIQQEQEHRATNCKNEPLRRLALLDTLDFLHFVCEEEGPEEKRDPHNPIALYLL